MTIIDIVNNFNTTPFLFVGSGISRRYLNLPDWKGLLAHFTNKIKDDPFAYSFYENRAKMMDCKAGVMPKIAELIQQDYDEKWFSDPTIRTVNPELLEKIRMGLSPFKAEIAAHIQENYSTDPKYKDEIDKLSEISEKSVSGVITTNYDTFLEDTFSGFKKYVGQNQLIFSAIQGIAEIYKIHGSVEDPESIIINEADYTQFDAKSAYLAAKLMTIFMEYPIVFIGYSISDSNIQEIIKSIVNCLDEQQVKRLEDRFVFVEYKKNAATPVVTPYTIMVDGKPLAMRKIVLSDFMPLYAAIGEKRAKLPVRVLRKFKQELYSYVITNAPTANLRVASIEDKRVSDEDLVLAIGRADQFGLRGLSGINGNDWYRNIILNDIEFTADELIEYAFQNLQKQNSNMLPVNKYLAAATKSFPECERFAQKQTFDRLINNTIKKNRNCLGGYRSVQQIWDAEKHNIPRAMYLISHLKEDAFIISELESVLLEVFTNDPNILETVPPNSRTELRRVIRIYDYLKWGK